MKFRKKPVVIEAYPYVADAMDLFAWERNVSDGNGTSLTYDPDDGLFINTLEGKMKVSVGDWVICGVNGEFYPCKNDIFLRTYEQAPEDSV